MNDLVSIIIPVYNAERYLESGVNSLLNQTYKNIEIILVDDHSTDKSWEISRNFAKKYPEKIIAIQTKQNCGGPFSPRVLGMKNARGKWITTMDCDDFVKKCFIENLINATENGKFDIAITGYAKYFSENKIEEFSWNNFHETTNKRLGNFYKNYIKNGGDFSRNIDANGDFYSNPADTLGQQLIRADVVKQALNSGFFNEIPNNIWAEDTLMAAIFLANSKKGVNFINKIDFYWRQREGSGSHGGFSKSANRKKFYELMNEIFANKYEDFSQSMPLISVIIPIYRTEKFLEECLKSVQNQTYKNLEIICVNDGSPDNSKKIIDEFAKKDSRIKKIDQKNAGLNIARKSGVDFANGEYITFVDSDDFINEKYCENLFKNLWKNNAEISISGYQSFNKKSEISQKNNMEFREKVIDNKNEILNYYLIRENYGIENIYQVVAWGRMFKAEIVKKTDWDFANFQTNEDEFESMQWFNFAKKIAINNEILYYYRQNPESKMNVKYKNKTPKGEQINQFDFAKILYEKTFEYLKNDEIKKIILWRFELQNRVFLERKILKNEVLENDEIKSLNENFAKILEIKNEEISQKNIENENLRNQIMAIKNSRKYKIIQNFTKIKRKIRK